ncbi:polysaccharide deacetylase family protein [Candidatus Sororendozoicomonas aggregata]|uniref:polysaccharide deacetylase family protein n=1 Tax=Candidatus Sororendozoicomonas aggregata TaxID=3073239 RepID=UPI002ED4D7D0
MLTRMIGQMLIMVATLLPLSLSAASGSYAVILQYHHVSNTSPTITSVEPALFSQHLDYLEQNKCHVIALTEVTDALRNNRPLPEKTVVITFDDAYKDIYTEAFPLLRKKGWPFTLFVSTAPVDKRYGNFLTWEQIETMVRHKATIANHTLNHDHLVEKKANESKEQWLRRVEMDILATEARIKEKTGQAVRHFAWPFGETVPELKALIAQLGFIGLGQHSGAACSLSDFSDLPRFPMAASHASMDNFRLKVNSLPLPVWQKAPVSSLISPDNLRPALTLHLNDGHYQKAQLRCYAPGQGEIPVQWLNNERTQFTVQAKHPLPVGRSRYNCTAPSISGRQYFWYSHPWLRLTEDGRALD